jgi:AraC family of transcriptional regulator, multidrug resistance transcriptional activator
MGISYAKFELRYRIKGAANQLVKSKDPIKKVVYNWSFADSSHLHRCFMEHYGCTPSQYRKRFSK